MLPKDYKKLQQQYDQQQQAERQQQQMNSPYYVGQQQRGVQLQNRIMTSKKDEDDNIYVNIVMDHPTVNFSALPDGPAIGEDGVEAKDESTKTIPILDKCSDYYCAVIRCTIPLDAVPLLIMPIIPNTVDPGHTGGFPDKTPFVIGIHYGATGATGPTVNFSQSVTYISENNLPKPLQNQKNQVITDYYFTYSYQTLLNMVNVALENAYNASPIPALLAPTVIPPPYFYLDPVTNLISLITHKLWTSLSAPLTFIPIIYMNLGLYTYFDSFFAKFVGSDQPFGRDLDFALYGHGLPNESQGYAIFGTAPTNPPTYFRFTQEYSSLEYWSSIRKIIIRTNTIPIATETIPPTNNIGDINVSYPILADFTPVITRSAGISRSLIDYTPPGQYKLTDLVSDNPLQKIDVQIFWEDRDGNLYPLLISVFQQASIKLGFFRKSLYKGTNLIQQ